MVNKRIVQYVKSVYKKGDRVVCYDMTDPYVPIQYGTEGTVMFVDDIGTIHVLWDNGRTIGLVYGEDSFAKC